MRCSVSPITSSAAADSPPLGQPADAARDDSATVFATLLVDMALQPISDAVGVLGSAVADQVAAQIARTAFGSQA